MSYVEIPLKALGNVLNWLRKESVRGVEEMPDYILEDVEKLELELQNAQWQYNPMEGQRASVHDVSQRFSRPDVYDTLSYEDYEEDDVDKMMREAEEDRAKRQLERRRKLAAHRSDRELDDMNEEISKWEKRNLPSSEVERMMSTGVSTGGYRRKHGSTHRFTHCKKHRHCRYCGKKHH